MHIRRRIHRVESLQQVFQHLVDVVVGAGQHELLASGRSDGTGHIRVGKERHRGGRAHQDQVLDILDMVDGQFSQVGQAINLRRAGAAGNPAGEYLGADPHAGGLADAAQHQAALAVHFPPADHDHAIPAGFQHGECLIQARAGHRRRGSHRHFALGAIGVVAPGDIRRQHQGGHLADTGLPHRLGRIPGDIPGRF